MLKHARSYATVKGPSANWTQLKRKKKGHEVGREWEVGVDLG